MGARLKAQKISGQPKLTGNFLNESYLWSTEYMCLMSSRTLLE